MGMDSANGTATHVAWRMDGTSIMADDLQTIIARIRWRAFRTRDRLRNFLSLILPIA